MTAPLATCAAEDAHRTATSDRKASADLQLSLAVTDAADLIRAGGFDDAVQRLTRAGFSAARILGESRPEVGA